MDGITSKVAPIQNIGLKDRTVRLVVGTVLLAYGVITIALQGSAMMPAVAILLGVYPLMTTTVGWDPFYELFSARTCSIEGGRHQCGTLPYELDAALGQNPTPEPGREYDHSYTAAHPLRMMSAMC